MPLYTSLLTTKDYGTVDLITTYQQLLGYIVFFQIEQAVFRFLIDVRNDKDKYRQKKIISSVVAFAIFQTVVLCITLFVISTFISFNYLRELCFVLCCYSVFMVNASCSTRSWTEFVVCVRKFYFGCMYDILQIYFFW